MKNGKKILKLITQKWTLEILTELLDRKDKTLRFNELLKIKGITPKILSSRTSALEKYGLIQHKLEVDNFPIKSFYTITEKGMRILKVLNRFLID